MRPPHAALIVALAATLAACNSGNIKSARSYNAPAVPPIRDPLYNPYAAYGSANATWTPPVWNRDGTVTKPYDPSVERGRPLYERAPWVIGAGSVSAPPGTF